MMKIYSNLETQFMMVNNGKFGGGRIILNPLGILNDGHFEMIFYKGLWGSKALKMFSQAKDGGQQNYDTGCKIYRIQKLRLTNKSVFYNQNTQLEEIRPQDVNIDGEDLIMKKSITYQCLPNELEILIDFKKILSKQYNAKL